MCLQGRFRGRGSDDEMAYLLQQLMTAAARRFPDRDAVTYEGESVTYAALDELTNRVARTLQEAGVAAGDRVGIYINKSIPSVVSLLSILKAGAVYVPLDPASPPRRLAYIIDNCGIRCLMTSTRKVSKVGEMFPDGGPLQAIVLTDEARQAVEVPGARTVSWVDACAAEASPPDNRRIETDLAYILYTSGSTGQPKGVMISHRTSLTFVNWARRKFGVTEEDRLSSHAPLHFDLSILDIFVSLEAGANIVLVPEGLSSFPFRLGEWIDANRITVWYSVPSILSTLLNQGKLDRFTYDHLRMILFAGEVFPTKYLRDLMSAVPGPRYFNLYGPTETNVITCYEVPVLGPDRTASIPIGTACENTSLLIVDDDGNVVTESGVKGELYARGTCLASGYWGDPEKTAGVFVSNFTNGQFEERVYRTGDVVALSADGNYEYFGRRDSMIKSRGYRIELGEIETALYSHPQVTEAAVIAVPDEQIGNCIHAFVVCGSGGGTDAVELKKHVSERLPRYMIPESIIFRDRLPKTSTGKVDKVSLAESRGER